MKITKFALCLSICFCAPQAMSAQWLPVTEADGMLVNIDKSSITILKTGERKAWMEYIFKEPQSAPSGAEYSRQLSRAIFNCEERSWKVLHAISYSADPAKGAVEDVAFDGAKFPYREVVPGSIAEAVLNRACASAVKK